MPIGVSLAPAGQEVDLFGGWAKSDGLRENRQILGLVMGGYRGCQMNTSLFLDNNHFNEPLLLPMEAPARSTKR